MHQLIDKLKKNKKPFIISCIENHQENKYYIGYWTKQNYYKAGLYKTYNKALSELKRFIVLNNKPRIYLDKTDKINGKMQT